MRRIAFLFLLFPFALSAQEDCDVFNIQGLAAENLALHDSIANFAVDTIILQPDGSFEVQLSNGTTFTQVLGCTDPADVNYNAAANTDDCSCASACCSIEFDGYAYSVVEIGDQCWFAENLRTTTYADGSAIPEETDNAAWTGLSTGARCDYDNDASNALTYGRLYNWYAVNNGSGLCPSGWHVPTDGEWTALETYLGANGHSGAEGTALKSTTGWLDNGNGTDDFGFSALPGGHRDYSDGLFFGGPGIEGLWWSSSPNDGNAWTLDLVSISQYFGWFGRSPREGSSVRCLRDADVLGCTDPAYIEYDAAANTDDGSCATPVVLGCTDPAFTEYDASANTDDGSCATLVVEGCTDHAYTEYNWAANTNDGSCATLLGCTDSAYLEYDAAAGADDGSCATLVVAGCTDPAYTEYNAAANTDDGSCATLLGCTDSAYLEYDAAAGADDGSCATLVVAGCTDPAYTEYNAAANTDDGSCSTAVVEGCTDSAYLEYNGSANTDDGSCSTLVVEGCTDSAYLEYNGSANTDDGSCSTAVVEGCTDSAYLEYNGSANTDDGSCSTAVVEGCTDSAYLEYNGSANTDDGSCATLLGCTDSAYLEYDAAAGADDGSCATLLGCTDSAYLEYDAAAGADDGSCATLLGCTDSAYLEYDAAAVADDGSCATLLGCTDAAYLEYDAAAGADDGSCSILVGCSESDVVSMDGVDYGVVTIGDQCWFTTNLRTTVYANGNPITEIGNYGDWDVIWVGAWYGAYCVHPDDLGGLIALNLYGRLYNWYAVDDSRGLCPSGWHVPIEGEWTELKDYITSQGFSGTEGTALRSTWGWSSGGNGTDDFGFSALPGGRRNYSNGEFYDTGSLGAWWSSSTSGGDAELLYLESGWPNFLLFQSNQRNGFSVRCLRDAE